MAQARLSRRQLLGISSAAAAAAAVGGFAFAGSRRSAARQEPRLGLIKIFEDHFDDPGTIDIDGTAGNPKWYTDLPWRKVRTPASMIKIEDSVLTIDQQIYNGNWALSTWSPWTEKGRSFSHGYFEARLSFDPTLSRRADGFPAFWSLPISQQDYTPDRHYGEIDFFEAYSTATEMYQGRFCGTVHDITLGEYYEELYRWSNSNNQSAEPLIGNSDWHTYGCRWEPGRLRWYFDDLLMHEVRYSARDIPSSPVVSLPSKNTKPQAGIFNIVDKKDGQVSVILGTGPGWPLRVDWVRVWA